MKVQTGRVGEVTRRTSHLRMSTNAARDRRRTSCSGFFRRSSSSWVVYSAWATGTGTLHTPSRALFVGRAPLPAGEVKEGVAGLAVDVQDQPYDVAQLVLGCAQ